MKAFSIRLRCGLLVAGALVLLQASEAASARADDKPLSKADIAAAKKHYGDGETKYRAGDFAGAEAEFKAANDIKAAPQTQRYIGLCEDGLGHFQLAADWYDKFLAHVPAKMATQGDEITKRDGEIKALPGKLHIDSNPPGATITIDDKLQPMPTPADVELPPGSHAVKLTAVGRLPTQKAVEVGFGSTQTVSADLEAQPSPALVPPPPVPAVEPPPSSSALTPAPPPPPEPRSKLPAYVTGGLAVVAAGVGTVFGIMTLSDKSNYDKAPSSSTADNGDTHALICDMSFGVALTFGVTSAVLFLTKDEPPPAAAAVATPRTAKAEKSRITVTPTPMVSAHSGGAGVLVRF